MTTGRITYGKARRAAKWWAYTARADLWPLGWRVEVAGLTWAIKPRQLADVSRWTRAFAMHPQGPEGQVGHLAPPGVLEAALASGEITVLVEIAPGAPGRLSYQPRNYAAPKLWDECDREVCGW